MIFMTCTRRIILCLWVSCHIFFTVSCLGGGIDKTGTVSHYHEGKVKTHGGGLFAIGVLPKNWQQKKIKERAILFLNKDDGASITVSSWCKSAFDDSPLLTLSDQLLLGITDIKRLETVQQSIAGRDALQTSVTGLAEGAPVYLRSYVMKSNGCVFDFLYVATPHVFDSVVDFDQMVQNFDYLQDPKS